MTQEKKNTVKLNLSLGIAERRLRNLRIDGIRSFDSFHCHLGCQDAWWKPQSLLRKNHVSPEAHDFHMLCVVCCSPVADTSLQILFLWRNVKPLKIGSWHPISKLCGPSGKKILIIIKSQNERKQMYKTTKSKLRHRKPFLGAKESLIVCCFFLFFGDVGLDRVYVNPLHSCSSVCFPALMV